MVDFAIWAELSTDEYLYHRAKACTNPENDTFCPSDFVFSAGFFSDSKPLATYYRQLLFDNCTIIRKLTKPIVIPLLLAEASIYDFQELWVNNGTTFCLDDDNWLNMGPYRLLSVTLIKSLISGELSMKQRLSCKP